jgi:hypothetical protein
MVLAGLVLACLLGALGSLVVAGVGSSYEILILTGLALLAALALAAVLVILLVTDRFPRHVLARLHGLEQQVDLLRGRVSQPATRPERTREWTAEVAHGAAALDSRSGATVDREPPAADPAAAAEPAVESAPPPVEPPPIDSGQAVPPVEPEQSRGRASFEFLLGSRGLAAAGMVVSLIALGLFLKLGWLRCWQPAGSPPFT